MNKIIFSEEQFVELKKNAVKHETIISPNRYSSNGFFSVIVPYEGKYYDVLFWSNAGYGDKGKEFEGHEVREVEQIIKVWETVK